MAARVSEIRHAGRRSTGDAILHSGRSRCRARKPPAQGLLYGSPVGDVSGGRRVFALPGQRESGWGTFSSALPALSIPRPQAWKNLCTWVSPLGASVFGGAAAGRALDGGALFLVVDEA